MKQETFEKNFNWTIDFFKKLFWGYKNPRRFRFPSKSQTQTIKRLVEMLQEHGWDLKDYLYTQLFFYSRPESVSIESFLSRSSKRRFLHRPFSVKLREAITDDLRHHFVRNITRAELKGRIIKEFIIGHQTSKIHPPLYIAALEETTFEDFKDEILVGEILSVLKNEYLLD